jgi:hypothetical protein
MSEKQFPGPDFVATQSLIRKQWVNRNKRIVRLNSALRHITDCSAQLPSKLLVSSQSLGHISDPKELESSVEAIHNEWFLLPQKCSTNTFWNIVRLHAPLDLIHKLPTRMQQRMQNEKQRQCMAQGLNRNGKVHQYKRRRRKQFLSPASSTQESASTKCAQDNALAAIPLVLHK